MPHVIRIRCEVIYTFFRRPHRRICITMRFVRPPMSCQRQISICAKPCRRSGTRVFPVPPIADQRVGDEKCFSIKLIDDPNPHVVPWNFFGKWKKAVTHTPFHGHCAPKKFALDDVCKHTRSERTAHAEIGRGDDLAFRVDNSCIAKDKRNFRMLVEHLHHAADLSRIPDIVLVAQEQYIPVSEQRAF